MIHKIALRCSYLLFGLFCLTFLSACTASDTPQAITPSPSPATTAASPTPTTTLTPTATPTPDWPDPNWGPVPEGALIRLGKGEPMGLAISPDGQFIVVGSHLGVFLYRLDTHEQIWYQTNAGAVDDVAYSPDGRWVAAAAGLDVLLFEAESGTLIHSWQVPDDPDEYFRIACEVAFSPDGSLLASISGNGKIALWDIAQGKMKRILRHESGGMSYPCGLAFSPDGTVLASVVSSDLTIFDPNSGRVLQSMRGESRGAMGFEPIFDLSFSPDGKTVVTGNGILWDMQSGQQILGLDNLDFAVVAFSPDGKNIASDDLETLTLWDAATGAEIWSMEHSNMNSVNDLQFSPDGQALIAAFEGQSIVFLETKTGKTLDSIDGHFYTMSLTFSKDSHFLASWDWAEIVRVWDLNSLRLSHTFLDAQISNLGEIRPLGSSRDLLPSVTFVHYIEGQATSANGKIRAIGDDDGVISIQDAKSGLLIKDLIIPGDYNPVHDLALSPDGKTLAAVDTADNSIWFFDIESGEPIGYLENSGWGIAYSPDGRYLATVAYDGSIVLWDADLPLPTPPEELSLSTPTPEPTSTPAPTATPPPHQTIHPDAGAILELAFGSDNSRLTILAEEGVFTYQNGNLQENWRWSSDNWPACSTISPDGKLVVSCLWLDTGSQIDVWEVATHRHLQTLSAGDQAALHSPTFSQDSKMLAAATGQGQVVLWDIATGRIVRILTDPSGAVIFQGMALSPDNNTLSVGGSYGSLYLWDLQTGAMITGQTLCRGDTTYDQAYSPDSKTLLIACGPFDYPLGFLSFWDVPGHKLSTYWDECGSIHELAYSPNGEMVALGYYDGWLELWPENDQPFAWLGHAEPRESWFAWDDDLNLIGVEHEVTALAFSPNSKGLASGSLDGSVIVWDISSLKSPPSPSGCALRIGQQIRADDNARLWSRPDASKGSITIELIPGQSIYILSGPVYGPVLRNRGLSGWFWEVSLSPGGESAGWIWQERVQECQ